MQMGQGIKVVKYAIAKSGCDQFSRLNIVDPLKSKANSEVANLTEKKDHICDRKNEN